MNQSGFQFKVGLFVCVGVGLLALLILNFSKGITFFNPTYQLRVVMPNAAGLKPSADVMMAGVVIGKVTAMSLAEDEKTVDITITILSKYKIRKDAKFHIDALGFLGDQYVSISPPNPNEPALAGGAGFFQNGDLVIGEPTFNMIEAVQSISGVVNQAKRMMIDLDQSITNLNASALSRDTLGHFVLAVSNLQVVSERAVSAANRAENLISENSESFNSAVRNFQAMSVHLTNAATGLDDIIATNRDDIRQAVANLTVATSQIKDIAQDLQAGKGPAGSLLKDEKMRAQLELAVSNADSLTAEFSAFGHNLNQRGIWAMLWRPKHPETNSRPVR